MYCIGTQYFSILYRALIMLSLIHINITWIACCCFDDVSVAVGCITTLILNIKYTKKNIFLVYRIRCKLVHKIDSALNFSSK